MANITSTHDLRDIGVLHESWLQQWNMQHVPRVPDARDALLVVMKLPHDFATERVERAEGAHVPLSKDPDDPSMLTPEMYDKATNNSRRFIVMTADQFVLFCKKGLLEVVRTINDRLAKQKRFHLHHLVALVMRMVVACGPGQYSCHARVVRVFQNRPMDIMGRVSDTRVVVDDNDQAPKLWRSTYRTFKRRCLPDPGTVCQPYCIVVHLMGANVSEGDSLSQHELGACLSQDKTKIDFRAYSALDDADYKFKRDLEAGRHVYVSARIVEGSKEQCMSAAYTGASGENAAVMGAYAFHFATMMMMPEGFEYPKWAGPVKANLLSRWFADMPRVAEDDAHEPSAPPAVPSTPVPSAPHEESAVPKQRFHGGGASGVAKPKSGKKKAGAEQEHSSMPASVAAVRRALHSGKMKKVDAYQRLHDLYQDPENRTHVVEVAKQFMPDAQFNVLP